MKNSDLIAWFQPVASRFHQIGETEFLDRTGTLPPLLCREGRLTLRGHLATGIYRGYLETAPGAFDMATAMIDMVRVPDGARVPVGPWDLDHIHNVMAMPMARCFVNGVLKGGLWFAMPGPEEIAESRLHADFGFEAQQGENEIVLELVERDRDRIDWSCLRKLELRTDDRSIRPLSPQRAGHPRLFVTADELPKIRARWAESSAWHALLANLRDDELKLLTDNSQGTLELATLVYALTGDEHIGGRAKEFILNLASAPTWSGRPDPLLMGGDNDRGISLRLYHTALAWEFLQPLFTNQERALLLAKANEYIRKIYDFTLLQRAYMGCPAIDPHSLGSWNGPAIACMAFYDDLPIARHALPFFHGLFTDSLTLFPASGKAAWATYFPFHLVLYLAAAHTFAGARPELSQSSFLDNLGTALLACFEAPNSQELQRGLRTREHRFLTAFLSRFHPTPGIDTIYRAFAQREHLNAGNITLGLFDILYAPPAEGAVAELITRPLYAKDAGKLIATVKADHTLGVSLQGGPKAGRRAAFRLMPQNREFAPALGAFELSVDGAPVLININISNYGIDSALTNAMCFAEGGAITNGQYLNGAVAPESCGVMRRCLIGERFVYAHVVVSPALQPKLGITRADRIFVLDRTTGLILIADSFSGTRAIPFATHLHCAGSVTQLSDTRFRMTGGQANRIAGIKGGSKQLDDTERGEIVVEVLRADPDTTAVIEEPSWIPGYIYGLNYTGHEQLAEARFPRYKRWRLATSANTHQASFLYAVRTQETTVRVEGEAVLLDKGSLSFGPAMHTAHEAQMESEAMLWDEGTHTITGIGVRSFKHGSNTMVFSDTVDLMYSVATQSGIAFAETAQAPQMQHGFVLEPWSACSDEAWRTAASFQAAFTTEIKKEQQ